MSQIEKSSKILKNHDLIRTTIWEHGLGSIHVDFGGIAMHSSAI
jgi:hypothetical protein